MGSAAGAPPLTPAPGPGSRSRHSVAPLPVQIGLQHRGRLGIGLPIELQHPQQFIEPQVLEPPTREGTLQHLARPWPRWRGPGASPGNGCGWTRPAAAPPPVPALAAPPPKVPPVPGNATPSARNSRCRAGSIWTRCSSAHRGRNQGGQGGEDRVQPPGEHRQHQHPDQRPERDLAQDAGDPRRRRAAEPVQEPEDPEQQQRQRSADAQHHALSPPCPGR